MTDPINQPEVEDVVPPDAPVGGLRTLFTGARTAKARHKAAADAAERRRDRDEAALRAVLATESGQQFVMRLLEHCRPYQTTLSSEPTQYAAAEGRRMVGLWVIAQVSALGIDVYPSLLVGHARRQREIADAETSYARNAR